MDIRLRLLATACLISVILMVGCVPGLQTAKTNTGPNPPADQGKAGQASAPGQPPGKPPFDKENLLATAPPPDSLGSAARTRMPEVQAADLVNKEEVSAAALAFAQGVPNAKHVKICYSKVAGGWSLFLYVEKGKKIIEQEYAWNRQNREWEFYAARKNLPANKMDIYLKGELPDEKCFVLK